MIDPCIVSMYMALKVLNHQLKDTRMYCEWAMLKVNNKNTKQEKKHVLCYKSTFFIESEIFEYCHVQLNGLNPFLIGRISDRYCYIFIYLCYIWSDSSPCVLF